VTDAADDRVRAAIQEAADRRHLDREQRAAFTAARTHGLRARHTTKLARDLPPPTKETHMAGDTTLVITGNLVADPELRFLPTGAAVANFTVASTPRTFDRQTNEWKDGEPLFMRCSAWKQLAENIAESLTKGTGVFVQGRLKQRTYQTKEGDKRTVVELEADEVGPTLKWATAKVTRAGRGNTAQTGGTKGVGNSDTPASTQQTSGGWGPPSGGYSEEPPF